MNRSLKKLVLASVAVAALVFLLTETAGLATKKPHIDGTVFGSITIDGIVFKHDVVITANGAVERRRFSGHTVSLKEVKRLFAEGIQAHLLIIGSGQSGQARLSPLAAVYAKQQKFRVVVLPTPKAMKAWNRAKDDPIGLFHVTC